MPKRFWTPATKMLAFHLKSVGWTRKMISDYFGCSVDTLDTMTRRSGR